MEEDEYYLPEDDDDIEDFEIMEGLDLFKRVNEISFNSVDYFKKVKEEDELIFPILYFLIINVLIKAFWRIPYDIQKYSARAPDIIALLGSHPYIVWTIIWIPLQIVGVIVITLAIYAFIKILGGKGYPDDTFKVLARAHLIHS